MSFNKYEPLPAIGSQNYDNELTNYRKDYVPHELQKKYVHQAEQYKKPEGQMDSNTSYKNDYTGITSLCGS